MKHKNILIEITDRYLLFDNPVKVFLNHNYHSLIGTANLTKKEDGLYADFDLKIPKGIKGKHYFSIMYHISGELGKIFSIGLCKHRNIDNRIKSIKL